MFLVEKVIMRFDNGPQIWKQFQEELEKKWAAKTSPQDTDVVPGNSNPVNTIPSAMPSKPSIEETLPGGTTAPDSLL
jgi:predicted phosphohydrolase